MKVKSTEVITVVLTGSELFDFVVSKIPSLRGVETLSLEDIQVSYKDDTVSVYINREIPDMEVK